MKFSEILHMRCEEVGERDTYNLDSGPGPVLLLSVPDSFSPGDIPGI